MNNIDIFQNLLESSLVNLVKNNYFLVKPNDQKQIVEHNVYKPYSYVICSGTDTDLTLNINQDIECNILLLGLPNDYLTKLKVTIHGKELSIVNVFILNMENVFHIDLELFNSYNFILQTFTNGSSLGSYMNILSYVQSPTYIKHKHFNLLTNTHWNLKDVVNVESSETTVDIFSLNILNNSNSI